MPNKDVRVSAGKFVKLLISSAYGLDLLPDVLLSLLELMDRSNMVIINSYLKRKIALRFGCSLNYVNVQISRYMDCGFMIRLGASSYFVNPNLFGKSSNREILQLQDSYETLRATAMYAETERVRRRRLDKKRVEFKGLRIVLDKEAVRSE